MTRTKLRLPSATRIGKNKKVEKVKTHEWGEVKNEIEGDENDEGDEGAWCEGNSAKAG